MQAMQLKRVLLVNCNQHLAWERGLQNKDIHRSFKITMLGSFIEESMNFLLGLLWWLELGQKC